MGCSPAGGSESAESHTQYDIKSLKKKKKKKVWVAHTHLEDLVLSLKVILLIRIALWKLVDVDPKASNLLSDLKAK